jgi:hypothetical protein
VRVDETEEVLAVGADAGEGVEQFRPLRFIEAFLHQLGIAEDGGDEVADARPERPVFFGFRVRKIDELGVDNRCRVQAIARERSRSTSPRSSLASSR